MLLINWTSSTVDDVVYISLINVLHQIVDVHIFKYCKAGLWSCFPGETQINVSFATLDLLGLEGVI